MSISSVDLFLEALPLPALAIGEDADIEAANALARKLLGEQILRRPYVAALRHPALVSAIEKCRSLRTKQTEMYATTVGNRDVAFDVHIAPAEKRLVLTFVDRSDAQDLDQFRRDFVANVSHELRTPLGSIIGFIETLRGSAKNDAAAQSRFLGVMASEAQRMSRLVDDLLSLSRVEETARKRPTTIVKLAEITAQAIAELQPVVEAAKATVVFEDESQGCEVLADAGQLRQVIGNLVENALRYGAPRDTIAISVSAPSYETRLRQVGVRLSVRDNGEGVAAHHLPRLTERFYRVESHRSREVGGTGLGLAIVKHIVQRHRGHLLVESTLGEGSKFTVILPILSENEQLS